MRNLKIASLVVIMALGAFKANAQSETFKPFKVDVALGYAMPSGSGSKSGVLFAVEPKYSISDQITLGLRMEWALTAYSYEADGQSYAGDIKATGSYLATADYMFNTNKVRPFAGLGVGIYSVAGVSSTIEFEGAETTEGPEVTVGGGTKFGFAPRVGLEAGHFRVAAEYNFAGKEDNINYNYLGIKVGFFFGGGRR